MVNHTDPGCTGNWRLTPTAIIGPLALACVIQCDGCSAEYAPTPENKKEAVDENYAGIYLRRLTAEGIARLGGS